MALEVVREDQQAAAEAKKTAEELVAEGDSSEAKGQQEGDSAAGSRDEGESVGEEKEETRKQRSWTVTAENLDKAC